jgi:hypothetical protein
MSSPAIGMSSACSSVSASASAAAASLAGLRRVDWIRLLVDDDHVGAEAVGVGYRLPTTCPIPVSLAARLIESGVPHVTRHLGTRA